LIFDFAHEKSLVKFIEIKGSAEKMG
jgi:hypothetical protein